jgi:hypothetical protein
LPREEKEIAKRIYEQYRKEKAGVPSEEIFTREYQMFEKTRGAGVRNWYEKLAKLSGKIFKYPVPKEQKQEIDLILASFNYDLEAEDVMSFAVLSSLTLFLLSVPTFFFSTMLGIVLIAFGAYALYYFITYPQHLMATRKSRAATEIILSILYIVIYMKNISNLEAAVRFAADNLEGPLGTDYRKMLWDISVKKYKNLQEALDNYLQQWKKYNEAFVDSIYLIETSLVQISEDRRVNMLDQALKRILDGTYEIMVHYVNGLRTPVSAVFMMGITLPIMGLVMLPLIGSFLANIITSPTLFVFYDMILPLIVIIIIQQILSTRPAAFPQLDLSNHPLVPPKDHFWFFGKAVHSAIPAAFVFLVTALPYFYYLVFLRGQAPSEADVIYSLFFILAISFAIVVYTRLSSRVTVKLRKEIKEIENDFAYAIFQIGNRLAEGVPAEVAMLKTAAVMKESKVTNFIRKISDNLSKLGMDLQRAIFDKVYGAVILYPSALIRSVMRIFIESTKESEEVAAASLNHVANYLQSVHNIEEKIKDVLSETLSTLKFQTAFISPLISGIIVGLTSMIMIILFVLGEKISAATSFAEIPSTISGGGIGGSMAFGFFEMSNTIPLGDFQTIIGIYLIEITIISIVLASKIEVGDDRINEYDSVSKYLLIATIIYFVVAIGVTIAFSGMARVAILLGEFG